MKQRSRILASVVGVIIVMSVVISFYKNQMTMIDFGLILIGLVYLYRGFANKLFINKITLFIAFMGVADVGLYYFSGQPMDALMVGRCFLLIAWDALEIVDYYRYRGIKNS